MKEIQVNKIKKTTTSKYNAQFGVPLGGRGKLGADNIYIAVDSAKKTEEKKQSVNEAPKQINEQTVGESLPVAANDSPKSLVKSAKPTKGIRLAAKRTAELLSIEEEERVISVNTSKKGRRFPISSSLTVFFFSVLLMFVIINYVQIFENQTMINELKSSIEQSKETERKLTAELEQKYDLAKVGDYASSELGMVGSENNQKVYIDIEEEDTIEVHEPETEDYGTIATVMNALGDTFKAWIDIFG